MQKSLEVSSHERQSEEDRAFWRAKTPEERLDAVERFRLEAGKFLYEYPTRLRRLLEVRFIAREELICIEQSTNRPKDQADVDELG